MWRKFYSIIIFRFVSGVVQTHKVPRPIDMPVYAVNYLLSEAQQLHMIDQLMFEFGGRENLARVRHTF